MTRSWPNVLRWCACFGIAIGFHVAGAAALMARWNESPDAVANAPVVMIDLAPVAVATQTTPTEVPPDQVESKQQIEPDPLPEKPPEVTEVEPEPEKPVEKVEPEPEVKAELAMLPPPKPPELEKPVEEKKEVKKKPRRRVVSVASAPSVADLKADRAAAPMPGANARDPNAMRNWTSQLVAQIERHKRYPYSADGASGTALVAFTVDRSGHVYHTRVVRSSGNGVLDRDAVSWVERSQPLPAPPSDRPGSQFPVVVPLRYNSR